MKMKIIKNEAGNWAWDTGRHLMEAACHHNKRKRGLSACGGCYARAVETLRVLAEDKQVPDAVAFIAALKEEAV